MGLVLLAFHWEWRDKSEVKHDLPELSEIERRRWIAKMKLAQKRASDNDLHFLANCLDHPQEEIAKLASSHLSENGSERALDILLNKIYQLDVQIEHKQKLLKKDFEDGFHARLVKEKPEQINNPVGYSCGQIHAKLVCGNYKLLEPYRSGPSQSFEGEELRHLLVRMIEDKQASFDHRSWALLSLSAFHEPPDQRLIDSCLQVRKQSLKIAAIQLVGYFKLEHFRSRLEVEIMSRDPAISIEAMYSLLQMRCTESLSKIEHMTQYGHGMVKEAAKYVCRQLRNPRA
tara:strand:+ start:3581 stop:4441 length:861 start_codon:yes stop_codon:yes gene_type:complete